MKIIVIHGPDTEGADGIYDELVRKATELGAVCEFFRGEEEGDLVTAVQEALDADGVILNAGAYSEYSIAIRDAISSVRTPVVEVNPGNARDDGEFRYASVLAPVCLGIVSGLGDEAYFLALSALVSLYDKNVRTGTDGVKPLEGEGK